MIDGEPTEAQMRRLRYYGIEVGPYTTKSEASELITNYKAEHPESEAGYQTWKAALSTRPRPTVAKNKTPSAAGTATRFLIILALALGAGAVLWVNSKPGVQTSSTPQSSGAVDVSDVGVQPNEVLLDHTKYSWKATLKNSRQTPVKLTAILTLMDAKGFAIETDLEPGVYLEAGEERVISKASIIKTDLLNRVHSSKVHVEVRR